LFRSGCRHHRRERSAPTEWQLSQSRGGILLLKFRCCMAGIKLVIFDIAGTIIQDHGEVVRAFSSALRQQGIPFTEEELRHWKGASKREVIRHFVQRYQPGLDAEGVVEATYHCFRNELEVTYKNRLHPIEGAAPTFAWCREHQIKLATTTGFYRELSTVILRTLRWHDLFHAIVSSSDVRQGRPAPFMIFHAMEMTGVLDVRQVISVGDTPLDLQAGNNAGLRGVIGVLTGEHDRNSLRSHPHTHIIDSVADLPRLIEREF
jgi:phosphoglycolate phosphatase